MDLGPVESVRQGDEPLATPEIIDLVDEECIDLLAGIYMAGGPVPVEAMKEVANEIVNETYTFRAFGDMVERRVGWIVEDMLDSFVVAGVCARTDSEGLATGSGRLVDGMVELTPAGITFVRDALVARASTAPWPGPTPAGRRWSCSRPCATSTSPTTTTLPPPWRSGARRSRRRGSPPARRPRPPPASPRRSARRASPSSPRWPSKCWGSWRGRRPPTQATPVVLFMIADAHPVRAVAKAARKASFQRGSWTG